MLASLAASSQYRYSVIYYDGFQSPAYNSLSEFDFTHSVVDEKAKREE